MAVNGEGREPPPATQNAKNGVVWQARLAGNVNKLLLVWLLLHFHEECRKAALASAAQHLDIAHVLKATSQGMVFMSEGRGRGFRSTASWHFLRCFEHILIR